VRDRHVAHFQSRIWRGATLWRGRCIRERSLCRCFAHRISYEEALLHHVLAGTLHAQESTVSNPKCYEPYHRISDHQSTETDTHSPESTTEYTSIPTHLSFNLDHQRKNTRHTPIISSLAQKHHLLHFPSMQNQQTKSNSTTQVRPHLRSQQARGIQKNKEREGPNVDHPFVSHVYGISRTRLREEKMS